MQLVYEDGNVIGVRNEDGDWWLAKRCLGQAHFGANMTTGPGYVFRLWSNGVMYVDDQGQPINNAYGTKTDGGLGSFAYQHSRGIPFFGFNANNAWPVASRICAEDYGWFGVARAWVAEGPTKYGGGQFDPLYWSIYVDLRTPWRDPIIRILYRYQFHSSVVKVWTRIWNYCGGAYCGESPYQHFAKEPKFIAQASPSALFGRTCVFDQAGTTLTGWYGADPRQSTGQTYSDNRARVRFDYGDQYTPPEGDRCSTAVCPCLNVVARGYPAGWEPTGQTFRWERDGHGLDHWAWTADSYEPPANPEDTVAGGQYEGDPRQPWDCHVGFLSSDLLRTWEQVGNGTYAFPFTNNFLGWAGGTGPYDCEPLARHFPPNMEFANHFQYSLNAGWGFQ